MLARRKRDLTTELLESLLRYDPETGKWTWFVNRTFTARAGSEAGYINSWGRRSIRINKVHYKAGRLAFFYMTGQWPKYEVDHINGDPLDDR
jgi:hypothetical protein